MIGLPGGRAATVDDLFHAGWQGTRIQPESAAQRVYTLVGQLRELGLRDVLGRIERMRSPDIAKRTYEWACEVQKA